jgi:hypothetical protein
MTTITPPALAEPALALRAYLESGGLLTPWAETRSGQQVTADIKRINPPRLFREEAQALGLSEDDNWAALRRTGRLIQDDGAEVARVTSVVALTRASLKLTQVLQTTSIPLGTAIGDEGSSDVQWCSVGICEFAVACGRVIKVSGRPVALTTDWVLWSWLSRVAQAR